jgi:uncharacterized protein (DUF885 family)
MPRTHAWILIAALGCGHGEPPAKIAAGSSVVAPHPVAAAAATQGVESAALAELFARHWGWYLAEFPEFATSVGDHRYDDRIDDRSLDHVRAQRAQEARFLDEARGLAAGPLSPGDREHVASFIEWVETRLAAETACEAETWIVDARQSNPMARFEPLADRHPVTTPGSGAALAARYRAVPAAIDAAIASLRHGAAAGRFAVAASVKQAITMIDGELARPTADWPMALPARADRAGWSAAEKEAFRRDLLAAVDAVRPALRRYRDALEREILPRARPDDRVGLELVPGGAACYAAEIRAQTSTRLGAEELHRLGLEEIERIDAEMRALGARLFGVGELSRIVARLRSDPALFFGTAEEVEGMAAQALAAAKARIPDFFGVLPRADCVVRRIPDYEAPFTTIAYYRQPNADGSKPGEYMINVYQPRTRPRFEAVALAYHESIPGHHLQIAIAQELTGMPAFRRHFGPTAFVEGWALYSERLADEMGLYPSDLDRMGMLSYDAWRAARLVVDTGIHAEGWSRERAVAYLMEHTALAENNIRNEVDRYINTPGQALAYKVGQLTIRRLRAEAERALGPRFDIKGFHDQVLGHGAVTMSLLEQRVRAWIATRR